MKIAITATGKDLSSDVDSRFGRTRYFLVVDTETGTVEAHDNTQNVQAPQGAGIQAGETVAGLGVEAVISGNFGPKAFRVLKAANIRAYQSEAEPVEEAVRKFKAGELTETLDA